MGFDVSDSEWIRVGADPFSKLMISHQICLFPRKCHYSGKSLWLKRAVRVDKTYYTLIDTVSDTRWYSTESYVLLKLRS